MSNADASTDSSSVSTFPVSVNGFEKSKLSARPTSKDYASEIQRLEMERIKLQTQQPLVLPRQQHQAAKNANITVESLPASRSDETMQQSTSKKQGKLKKSSAACAGLN